MLTDGLDRAIIKVLQGDIPLTSRPFSKLAQELAIPEQEVVQRITAMEQDGRLRRWGAVLRHRQAGYQHNAMVAWKIAPGQADQIGQAMAAYPEISHCYLRQVPADFGYCLFTMIHARSAEALQEIIRRVSEHTGLSDYVVLASRMELKKASMTYLD